jgi:membrane-associated phospholipid phosphatase
MTDSPSPDPKRFRILVAAAAVAVLFALYAEKVIFLPKLLAYLVVVAAAVMVRRMAGAVRDWFVFLSFVQLADGLRGLIYLLTCRLGLPVHVLYPLRWERALFGEVPSVSLQNVLLHSPDGQTFGALEKALTALHGSHFIFFLGLGLVLWLLRSARFRLFRTSFTILLAAGISGFALAPTAPPWMASEVFGFLPRLVHFNIRIYNSVAPGLTTTFNTNPVAAMPSLHAAFPILCGLILWAEMRWRSWPFQVYTLLILFTIVYTGDHYVVDILAGALLAAASCLLARKILKHRENALRRARDRRLTGLVRPLAAGGTILAASVLIGLITGSQFEKRPERYDYRSAPRYVDVLAAESGFANAYGPQMYFGNHELSRGEDRAALSHFEKALSLAGPYAEKKSAEVRIKQVRGRLGLE